VLLIIYFNYSCWGKKLFTIRTAYERRSRIKPSFYNILL